MDFSSPTAVARMMLPKVPFMLSTALWHTLYLSPTSSKWDLKTEVIIRLIRTFLENPKPHPLLVQQRASLRDPGIKGKMWISKVTLPAPNTEDTLDLLCKAIEDMKESGHETYAKPALLPVYGEWTGFRPNVDANRPRPDLSEEQHYKKLMGEVSSNVTILYFHGGAYYMMDPASHRIPCSRLAQLTKGRCFNVRYRLAPQNAFPAALLDALVAYLSLLYPPPGSYHSAVPANHIVFAGDSAGAGLSLALVQLLLQINRTATAGQSIEFHNAKVPLPLPLPAGAALNSVWCDLTRSMPSIDTNYHYDYLPPPMTNDQVARFPPDSIWPTDPPRGDLYCEVNMLCHPLTSPLAAKDWRGCPPLWLGCGEEMLGDEGKILASRTANQGVKVQWAQWETMPHCFALILAGSPIGKRYFEEWAGFASRVVGGQPIETKGIFHETRRLKEIDVDVKTLAPISDEEVKNRMERAREARQVGVEGEAKLLPRL